MDTVGYARIFTTSQHLDMQLDALKAAGCTHIRTDTTSGTLAARPGLDGCALAEPEEDDTLVVWRLDRLGRSLPPPLEPSRTSPREASIYAVEGLLIPPNGTTIMW